MQVKQSTWETIVCRICTRICWELVWDLQKPQEQKATRQLSWCCSFSGMQRYWENSSQPVPPAYPLNTKGTIPQSCSVFFTFLSLFLRICWARNKNFLFVNICRSSLLSLLQTETPKNNPKYLGDCLLSPPSHACLYPQVPLLCRQHASRIMLNLTRSLKTDFSLCPKAQHAKAKGQVTVTWEILNVKVVNRRVSWNK